MVVVEDFVEEDLGVDLDADLVYVAPEHCLGSYNKT